MKFRSGFVSNSSSSSFVLSFKKSAIKQLNISEKEKEFIEKFFEKETIFGFPCLTVSGYDHSGESWLGNIEFELDEQVEKGDDYDDLSVEEKDERDWEMETEKLEKLTEFWDNLEQKIRSLPKKDIHSTSSYS